MELKDLAKANEHFDKCLTLIKNENRHDKLQSYKAFRAYLLRLAKNENRDIALKDQLWTKAQSLDSAITLLKDTLYGETNQKALADAATQYDTEKKEKTLAQQRLALANQALELKTNTFELHLAQEEANRKKAENHLLKNQNELDQLKLTSQQASLKQRESEAAQLANRLGLERENSVLKSKALEEEVFLRNGILLLGFTLIVIGFLVFNSFRLRRKLQYQAEVLNQRKRLSADLHDDVGATLSSINIYTEAIKTKLKNNEPERVMELVNKIGENSRETISTLGDIVWNLNPINDAAERLFNRMGSTATLLLSAQNMSLDFRADPQLFGVDFSLEAKQNLYLTFKETINNAAKYARASEVKVSIKKAGNELEMKISDNGIGFDVGTKSEGNGLRNIRLRTEALGGKATLSSSETGTVTCIQLLLSGLGKA